MRKTTQIRSAIALLIGATLLVPAVSIAIDEGDLNEVARENCKPGRYQRVGPVRTGTLEPKGKVGQLYSLTTGQNYCFVAVGDEQALDVDLEVLNGQGSSFRPPAEDRRGDEIAYVVFRARQRGRHQVQVEMFDCQTDRCEYALAAYKRIGRR